MIGLAQAAPEAVIAAAAPQGSSTVGAALVVATERSWMVQAVGADAPGALTPTSPGLPVSAAAIGRGVSVAGSAAMVEHAGPAELGWALAGAGRMTLVDGPPPTAARPAAKAAPRWWSTR